MDDQILSLYAKGMSTRDIVAAFKDLYVADISACDALWLEISIALNLARGANWQTMSPTYVSIAPTSRAAIGICKHGGIRDI